MTSREELFHRIFDLLIDGPEGLTLPAVCRELGISTSYGYSVMSDPTGEGERKRKEKYKNTCEVCGVEIWGEDRCVKHQRGPERQWTEELVIEAFKEFDILMGHPPTDAEFRMASRPDWCPTATTVYDIFGKNGWNKAMKAAGFRPRPAAPPWYARPNAGDAPWDNMSLEDRESSREAARRRYEEDPDHPLRRGQEIGKRRDYAGYLVRTKGGKNKGSK